MKSDVDMPTEPERFCLRCRHSLRGLRSHRCPECGRDFDPDDPRTTTPNPHHRGCDVFAGIARALIAGTGLAAGLSIIASWLAIDPMWLWLGAICLAPIVVLMLPLILLPAIPIGRGRRILGVAFPILFLSVAVTSWPFCLRFQLHKELLQKVVDQVRSGVAAKTPRRVGMFRFRIIHVAANGNVGFQLTGGAGGGTHLVKVAPGAQWVWNNTNWEINLGDGWYYVDED